MGQQTSIDTPIVINQNELDAFRAKNEIVREVDIYDLQLEELARIKAPNKDLNQSADVVAAETSIYFPWNKTLLRCVGDEDLYTLRTNRNRELITTEEQQKLASSVVGVAGMSVGAGIALGLAYSGISRQIKIADHDVLDTSNLNRLRETLGDIGQPKTVLAARHIYELDPFAKIHSFNGINADNIDQFFSDPKIDVMVDEIDDFKMKVQLRLHAKKYQIPILMFTSLGDNILIDVERFDRTPEMPIFHGILDSVSEEILANPEISPDDIRKYSVQLVGQEYIPTRALKSVTQMGRTLVGRPQLYSTIAVDGGLAAYVIRRLLLQGDIESGRYFVNFNALFNIADDDLGDTPERQEVLSLLFKGPGS